MAIDPLQQILDLATHHGLLHKIRGWGTIFHTSLYADIATVFAITIGEDSEHLAIILRSFREFTGLDTNF